MAKVYFICYSGSDRHGNTYEPYKAIAHTADEAIGVINTWKTYGKKDSEYQIRVNALTEKKIRNLFRDGFVTSYEGGKDTSLRLRTTGCGCWDICISPALADTLEEHERIVNERREAARQERIRQSAAAKQRRLAELNEQRSGWYHVQMELCLYVFANRGNDRRQHVDYSCNMIADSGMDAYNKTLQYVKDYPGELTTRSMERRGDCAILESACDPTSGCYKFTFLGVKTDEGYSLDKWNEWKENGEI